jgi:flagellar protein FliO/FliZ
MQWLNELPFADNRVLQIGFLLACGIAALIVLALLYRLAFAHRLRVPGGRTRQPRLGLVDAFSLDGQRQLVLVRRDNVEHLVMIGGPNDVLVESQINRAAVPARENIQTSPLLVPSASVRQVPLAASAVAEAPAPVAAKVPATPPQPAAAPVVPKAPAPAQPSAPVSTQAPAAGSAQASPLASTSAPAPKPVAPDQPRPAAAPQPLTQAADPVRSPPASSPPPRQGEPRPTRPAMPPPIVPTNAAQNRTTAARALEQTVLKGLGNSPSPAPAAPVTPRRSEKPEPAVVRGEPAAGSAKTEPVVGPTVTVPAASATLAQARPAPKSPPPFATSDVPQKMADTRAPADRTTAMSSAKPPVKVDDPFADLDSLETEMARLLGREKSD